MKTNENLFIGKNILQSDIDILEPLSLKELFNMISEPEQQLIELAARLMKVKNIDEKAFQSQKVKLPYFIGARFKDNLRNTKNFISIHWVIIDIDKCFDTIEKEIEVKEMFKKDRRVALMFTSPSNEGLKLVFKLDKPITDTALYINFYKAFTSELARNYKIEKYLDFKTSDVTRVSFITADLNAFYNQDALQVDWEQYLSEFDIINRRNTSAEKSENDNLKKNIDDDVYAEILRKLNPKTPKRKKIIYVPEALNSIIPPIKNYAKKTGLPVAEVRDIHYGKKLIFKRDNHFAEINVFYGKNGFTVIISPKRGHHEAMSKAAKALIEKVIFDDSLRPVKINTDNKTILPDLVNNINPN